MDANGQILRADQIDEIAYSECICTFFPRSDCAFTGVIDAMTFCFYAEAIEMDSFTGCFRLADRVVGLDLGVDGAVSAESSLDDIFSGAIRSTAR